MTPDPNINDRQSVYALIQNGIASARLQTVCRHLHRTSDFWTWPASLSYHHAYEGGLIAHTLEVVDLALYMAEKFPEVNHDVLIAACLWHDFGKIYEYAIEDWRHSSTSGDRPRHLTRNDDSTGWNVWIKDPKCRSAHDHIITSAQEFVVAARMAGVDPETEEAVVHCILAHHGPVKEWGSPVAPQTPEAWLLHWADMQSAKFGATKEKP